ncbi:MAG TPA: SPFH domain-containing protein [Blastocatellia bacterium]|nr:SPFH domain-containing protein [Blastocatellia bacterium]
MKTVSLGRLLAGERGSAKLVAIATAIVFVLAMGYLMTACHKVEPGYVGIVVDNYGSQRGVESMPIRTGRVWINPFTQSLHTFPTFQQTVVWTRSKDEGKAKDESITFNAAGGTPINADISISYAFVAEKVPELFIEFRQDAETITDGYMRSRVRDAFNVEGGKFQPIEIMAEKKQALLDAVKKRLEDELSERGFRIDYVSFIHSPRPPDNIQAAINNVIQAQQEAAAAQAVVAKKKAEAEQAVAVAEGEAKAILTRARAQAEANNLLQKSLTELQIRYEALQKWDGHLPQIQGGNAPVPFISLGNK